MIVTKENNTAITSGAIGVETQFKIAATGKVFRALSSSLYKDKIGSIVREVSSNAADSHVAAGKPDAPFTIHLPNGLEPWFSVKDEGVGLSEDKIRNLYTIYGESSKDQSNNEIGGFGFGSKTPFAYTDQFSITSVYNGEKKVYNAMISASGEPVINLMVISETTDPNGIEVTLPVEDNDFVKFSDAVKQQLMFFKVKPTLINNFRNVVFVDVFNPDLVMFKSNDFTFLKPQSIIGSGLYVVLGGVNYPIEFDKLGYGYYDEKPFKVMVKNGAFLEIPIGSINVILSREGIEYTEETITFLKNKINTVKSVMVAELISNMSKIDNLWERVHAFYDLASELRSLLVGTPVFADLWTDPLFYYDVNGNIRLSIEYSKTNGIAFSKVRFIRESSQKSIRLEGQYHCPFLKRYVFVIKDNTANIKSRLLYKLRQSPNKIVVLVTNLDDKTTDLTVESFNGIMKNPTAEVVYASDLYIPVIPKEPRKARGTGGKFKGKQFSEICYITDNCKNWEDVEDITTIPKAVYVKQNYNKVEGSTEFNRLSRVFDSLGIPIIAVTGATFEKIESKKLCPNWVTPAQEYANVVAKIKQQEKKCKSLIKARKIKSIMDSSQTFCNIINLNIPEIARIPTVVAYKKIVNYINYVQEEVKSIALINEVISGTVPATMEKRINGTLKKLTQQFSMLSFVRNYSREDLDFTTEVEKYIRLVLKNT